MNGWQPTLRNFGIITLKTAVGALIVNSTAWLILPANFNLITRDGIWNIGKLAAGVVIASEAKVWIPKLLRWSETPTTLVQDKLAQAQVATKEAVVATKAAESAVTEAKAVAPSDDKKNGG